MTALSVNDWVYSESSGVWRVYRIIKDVRRFRFSRQERQKINKHPLLFVKRLVDRAWSAAFCNEMATDTFVRVLSEEDRQHLDEWIVKNPEVIKRFDAFLPAPIDLVVNLALYLPQSSEKDRVKRLVGEVFAGIENGLTNDTILQRLASSEFAAYAPKSIRNATLQFVSKDHEHQNGEYIFREVRLV